MAVVPELIREAVQRINYYCASYPDCRGCAFWKHEKHTFKGSVINIGGCMLNKQPEMWSIEEVIKYHEKR